MKVSIKQRLQLSLHILFMLLILLALIACAAAWFSSRSQADVNSINLTVERTELKLTEEITRIEFPCATKIADTDTTPDLFNTEVAVAKTYTIDGEGKLMVSVETVGAGMVGYVCDSVKTTDYYGELLPKLEEKLGDDPTQWTYGELQEAIAEINRRRVGDFVAGMDGTLDTQVKIVYWVEYSQIENNLNTEGYWSSDDETNPYKAIIIFVS